METEEDVKKMADGAQIPDSEESITQDKIPVEGSPE